MLSPRVSPSLSASSLSDSSSAALGPDGEGTRCRCFTSGFDAVGESVDRLLLLLLPLLCQLKHKTSPQLHGGEEEEEEEEESELGRSALVLHVRLVSRGGHLQLF